MYSLEEAQKEFADAEKGHSEKVVQRLPSFRGPMTRKSMRQPSFFQKMFSSKKLDRVHSEYIAFPESGSQKQDDESLDQPLGGRPGSAQKKPTEEFDGETIATADQEVVERTYEEEVKEQGGEQPLSREGRRQKPGAIAEDGENEDDGDELEEEIHPGEAHYPRMPKIGVPVNTDRLVNRTKVAATAMKYLMDMVSSEVDLAIHSAKTIPVSKELDRVQVTPEISRSMAQVRSTYDIQTSLEGRVQEIQKSLNYRKSGLIMMNVNYSNKLVRKIEPIYVGEARTIMHFK